MDEKVSALWNKEEKLREDISSLREEIRAGRVSLRGRLDEFVFCQLGANPKWWVPFVSLKEQIERNKGKEILVVRTNIKTSSGPMDVEHFGGGPPSVYYNVDRECDYGVLSGAGLGFDLESGRITFPTGGYHVDVSVVGAGGVEPDFSKFSDKKVRGRIGCEVIDFPHLYSEAEGKDSRILIGSKVGEYFVAARGGRECYDKIKKNLS